MPIYITFNPTYSANQESAVIENVDRGYKYNCKLGQKDKMASMIVQTKFDNFLICARHTKGQGFGHTVTMSS